jgi:hypothetical protein
MASLPRSYVNVVQRMTGYWGAFPLHQELAPGAIGRKGDGVFSRETDLSRLPGYDAARFSASLPQNKVNTDAFVSEDVHYERTGVGAGGGVLPVGGQFRLSFGAAGQGAVACRGTRVWSFDDIRAVKQHVIELYKQGSWDVRNILVVRVLVVDAAWVMVASQRGQSIDLTVSGGAGPIGGATDLLKAVLGSATVDFSHGGFGSVGYSGALPEGGTPLFEAIRLKRFPRLDAQRVVRGLGDFEVPVFGVTEEND